MTIEVPPKSEKQQTQKAAKFHGMPRAQRGRIDSPRLARRYQRPAPLTVVRAPHGFGKSMLVSQWLRSLTDEDIDVLWFSYDWYIANSNDCVEEAWESLSSRLEEFDPSAETPPDWSTRGPRDRILHSLASRQKPIYIVLDRYVEPSGGTVGVDQTLIEFLRASENLFLIVCTRDVTAVELVSTVMVDSLVLRPADLALRPEDIVSIAAQESISLTRGDAVDLCDATGGWPALVRVILAASAAQSRPGEPFQLHLYSGSWFLRSVWKEFTNSAVGEFVDRTGFVGEFTAEIAAEICDGIEIDGALEELTSAGLLTVQLTDRGPVYSHLPAVHGEVRQRLQANGDVEYRDLSLRAARLHRQRGHLTAALSFLVRAELWEPLFDLIEETWGQLLLRHERDLLEMALSLPSAVVVRSPHLVALLVQQGLDSRLQPNPSVCSLPIQRGLGSSLVYKKEPLTLEAHAGPAVSHFYDVSPAVQERLPEVLYEWGLAKLIATDPPAALTLFEESYALAVSFEVTEVRVASALAAALVNVVNGRSIDAQRWLVSHREAAIQSSPGGAATSWDPLLQIVDGLNTVSALTGRGPISSVLALPTDHVADDLWALSLVARSHVAILTGQQFSVLEEFDRHSDRLDHRPPSDLMRAMLTGCRVDLWLSLGQVFRARAALSALQPKESGFEAMRARVAYFAGNYAQAVLIASQALQEWTQSPRMRLALLLTVANAEAARDRRAEAIQALREAVTLSADSGYRLAFCYVRREVLLDFSAAVPELTDILNEISQYCPDDVFPAPSVIAELSEREREVLVELAKAKTLAGVARALYLTTNTVKTHLRSIYRKLDTHSAAQTIERAIECGLIDVPVSKVS